MQWINVTAETTREMVEGLEEWFWEQGAVSVSVEDALDQPLYEPGPGEQPLWEKVLVTGLFEDDIAGAELIARLSSMGYRCLGASELPDRPWERAWLDQFRPMQFGRRLWICPTDQALPETVNVDDQVVVHLDPGLAFGTGTHETTRLCLEYLDGLSLAGLRVIDYGCGSGVLGIASCLLGAGEVHGVDNDPQALTATRDNAARNGVDLLVSLPGEPLEPADLVVANILASPLVDLSGQLRSLLKAEGTLVLSGILASQSDWVAAAYRDQLTLVDQAQLNDWVRQVWRKT